MKNYALVCALGLAAAGPAAAEVRQMPEFAAISVSSGVPIEVTVGAPFRVEVAGQDAERVQTRVANGVLMVGRQSQGWRWGRHDALVRVSMPSVTALDASSGSRMTASGVSGGDVSLEASSGARLIAAGTCGRLKAEASSGARLDAAGLHCAAGAADASSGARAIVHVSGRLDVEASSGGDVVAGGGAEIGAISLSSGGSLRRASQGG